MAKVLGIRVILGILLLVIQPVAFGGEVRELKVTVLSTDSNTGAV
jgi:hypothetical protein